MFEFKLPDLGEGIAEGEILKWYVEEGGTVLHGAQRPTKPDHGWYFEPTIIAFVCNWCTYTAADLAGTSRLAYPKNIRLIRVMCTGMVDPQYVIKAFLEGADGVLISGCHPGDCHYHEGNYKCLRRYHLLQKYLQQVTWDRLYQNG